MDRVLVFGAFKGPPQSSTEPMFAPHHAQGTKGANYGLCQGDAIKGLLPDTISRHGSGMETQITLPFPPNIVWGVLTFAGITLASILTYVVLPKESKTGHFVHHMRERLGIQSIPIPIFLIAACLWIGISLILVVGLCGLILEILTQDLPNRDVQRDVWDFRFTLVKLTALTTVLGAIIALPLTMARLRLQRRANKTADESLFNEKINAATQGLYARRQISTLGDDKKYQDHWQDDIVQRCAAIDRLEGLARENNAETPRIARLLSVYVCELSSDVQPQAPLNDATPEELRNWAEQLPKPRSDMEKATQTLGRLHEYALSPLDNGEIDLRGANLQKCDLRGLTFDKALFQDAQLQGANLSNAQLQGANLFGAQLQGAGLRGAQLQGADLFGAQLQGANLRRAQFDAETSLISAGAQGAAIKEVDFTNLPQITEHLQDMFGDASVKLPDGVTKPDYWPDKDLKWGDFDTQWHAWQATLEPGWDAPDD
ncbi:MAG: pentapeptide repeat-containing protein [Tateyamaria sp.]|uniref:pentapeptide repeat-containing protein n=1 Tax=Tateyamaria sp. TaxID=1929288 RepID=UPI00329EA13A